MDRTHRKAFLLDNLVHLSSGQDLLPLENDTLQNPAWEDASCHVLISRLSPSRDVEESVSHLVLFRLLRKLLPDAYLDFSFFPPARDRRLFEASGCTSWFGTRSFASAGEFDLVLVSVSYVLELINLPYLLGSAGLALAASARAGGQEEGMPVILAGGSASLMSQSVLGMVDALYTDTFESMAQDLVRLVLQAFPGQADCHPPILDRTARGHLIAGIRGIPGMAWADQGVMKEGCPALVPDGLPDEAFQGMGPVLNNSHASTVRLLISSGCPFRCSFCFEGAVRKPYAEAPVSRLLDAARMLRRASGAESVDLLSFNFNTHRDIMGLMSGLMGEFPFVHLMSQRLDILFRRPELLQAQIASGKRSFTLGIEGISSRMRRFFRKDLAEEAVGGITSRLILSGAREIKCFYILSGYEEEKDFQEFASFVKHCMDARRDAGSGASVLFSFGYLSLMPHTPLTCLPVRLDPLAFRSIHSRVKTIVEDAQADFRLAFDEASWILGQVLSLGDFKASSRLLEELHQASVTFEDSPGPGALGVLRRSGMISAHDWERGLWNPPSPHAMEAWCRPQVLRARESGIREVQSLAGLAGDAQRYSTGSGELSEGRSQSGVGETDPLHDGPSGKDFRLEGNGAEPPLPAKRSPGSEKDLAALAALRSLENTRRKPGLVHVLLSIPQGLAGACTEWTEAWISRRILEIKGCQALLRVQDAFHGLKERRGFLGPWHGEGIWAVSFDAGTDGREFVQALETGLAGFGARVIPGFEPSLVSGISAVLALQGRSVMPASPADKAFRASLQSALAKSHVQATLVKCGGGFIFEVSPRLRRKSVLQKLAFTYQATPGWPILELKVMSRFGIRDFLDQGLLPDLKGFLPLEITLDLRA